MSTRILSLLPLLALIPFAACTDTEAGLDGADAQAPAVTEAAAPAVRPASVTDLPPAVTAIGLPAPVEAQPLDPLSPPPAAEGIAIGEPAPIPAAAPGPARTGQLGTTVASLGSPTSPGLWLETALVSAPGRGRVEYNGQSVEVELRPSGGEPGSGSQISLDAMRALGAPLTGLPELTVYGG